MKTIKGLLGYVGFGVSAIISQGRQALGPGSLETGTGKKPPPSLCSPAFSVFGDPGMTQYFWGGSKNNQVDKAGKKKFICRRLIQAKLASCFLCK